MKEQTSVDKSVREPLLNPVDRISEMLFGLLMALTFVGAVSVAESGRTEIRAMFAAALGCNLAWGLVDAVMYTVRSITDRGRWHTLIRSVRAAPDAKAGRALVERSLSRDVGDLLSADELETLRGRIVALPGEPAPPGIGWNDLLAALAVFLLVVLATFPVVLPFVLTQDVGTAKWASRIIALVMLFLGGLGLGRYAGYGSWKVGFIAAGLGAVLVAAINALGG